MGNEIEMVWIFCFEVDFIDIFTTRSIIQHVANQLSVLIIGI